MKPPCVGGRRSNLQRPATVCPKNIDGKRRGPRPSSLNAPSQCRPWPSTQSVNAGVQALLAARDMRDLQDLAERLDPEGIAMLVDEVLQDLSRRSSSAWAKNALASFNISLAQRNSLTSSTGRCVTGAAALKWK